ncbi:MAG: hypothetical protein EAZ44_07125 [Cytophagia bacterium]|nr:MAG: hypothetical protein EAY69_11085 [Cytophagales bacterium]TAG02561.1 MAG: hypothetical protein EAZ44_07125 [Cytophagia bacterium]TAG43414.1 MAG: hypothetical protein EAZ31_04280 [Cytophagia bacterium]TAH29331.1 MAG: hypothetical protein EAZ06_07050 [Cytophagales bacterium]
MKKIILIIIQILFTSCSFGQTPIDEVMKKNPLFFKEMIDNKEKYPIEIIFTRIIRDSLNHPNLETYTYFTHNNLYFNPASIIKLPICALSLEKLNEWQKPKIHANTRIGAGKGFECQTEVNVNESKLEYPPTIARYIEKLLLVSDNEGYTRLYEFLGQKYIKRKLEEKNYQATKIIRRFTNCDTLQNRYTNPIYFYNDNGELLYSQDMAFNNTPFYPQNTNWSMPEKTTPMNIFNPDYENEISLMNAHEILTAIVLPESIDFHKRFRLSNKDYELLWYGLGSFPNERKLTIQEDDKDYFPAYKKYLFYGRQKDANIQKNIRILNVVGWWGGVVTDCAYIIDFENKIELLVSARIGINHNEINESDAYHKYSFPFMQKLGEGLYEYEKSKLNEKKYLPNLKRYQKLWSN